MNYIPVQDLSFSKTCLQLLDLLDDGIIIVDHEGVVIVYNSASERLDKLKRKNVIGKRLIDSFFIDRYTSITLKTLETKKKAENVYQNYTTIKGKRVSTVSSSYPLRKDKELVGAITLTKDISRFKETLNVFYNHDIIGTEVDQGKALFTFDDIIGQGLGIQKTKYIANMASRTMSNILIYGETGTGKELFAQSIHNNSPVTGKFVSINCAAIPENLLEGILFGTAKGAFTGAMDHPGLFEEAKDGTLFLDEINSMSLGLQSKLLRAIETGKIRRLGETEERVVRPRILSALNIHPSNAIEKEIIRMDLFYRLGVVTVIIPPLRERKEDIPLLTEEFIKKFNIEFSKDVEGITKEVAKVFENHNWPGNVRELEHTIEHSMIMMRNDKHITLVDLPPFIQINNMPAQSMNDEIIDKVNKELQDRSLTSVMDAIEKEIIKSAVEEANGNVTEAAKQLNINRQNLDYRIKKYKL